MNVVEPDHAPSPFPATRWTAVLKARNTADPGAAERALADLCRDYWYPLYAFARRSGRRPHDAEDLTQGFFAYVLSKKLFDLAAPERGKLRTFLLTAFERYLGDVRDHEHALKRGGGREIVSLDVAVGENWYGREPADQVTPEKLFERSWALTILRSALRQLAAEEAKAGRGAQFEELEAFLSPDSTAEPNYGQAAARLGLSEDAMRQIVSRLRKKCREQLRRLVADTLHDPSEAHVEEELATLRSVLRG